MSCMRFSVFPPSFKDQIKGLSRFLTVFLPRYVMPNEQIHLRYSKLWCFKFKMWYNIAKFMQCLIFLNLIFKILLPQAVSSCIE